ncbi:Pex19-domain-containing protein [Trichocladium antarcticum]|uniref:Pex19-domain-containing protein n=1 Tax=Trichocladium antarcticum TaxID=1450529 RepID=A0AAN6UTE9_9PEZI|nr:Pex19-domain-containing protein [Trichocladium antarcticum]
MEPNAGDIATPKEDVDVAAPPAPTAPTAPAAKIEEPKTATVEDVGDVSDPDEDDLDDLDGNPSGLTRGVEMLEDFAAVKVDAKKPEVSVAAPEPAAASITEAEGPALSEDDFAKQLQAGMADLLGELDNSPEMQAQFESIFKELGAAASTGAEPAPAAPTPAPPGPAAGPPAVSAAEATFQETIRRTMERMQAGGDQATAAAAAEGSDDFMAELLKQMQSGGGPEGEGNEEEFSKMLMGMMDQLTNKEILYEPMKELHEKFPGWMEKNRDKVPAEELSRYEAQQTLVREIVLKFEDASFSDSNKADREYIVDRMQKMQASGSPPSDLVGDMPSAQDALSMPDESCNPQ